jgi:putative hydrolase of the HAD superfamily
MPPIEAVTFDFWETLIHEAPLTMREGQIQGWVDALHAEGLDVAREDVAAALTANWGVFDERWAANDGQHTPVDAVAFMCRHLGVEPDDALRRELVDVFTHVGETAPLELAPGIEECLLALREAGVAVGIVCDVGMTPAPTLRLRLERHGVLAHFRGWAFSDETGWFKPAPEAFAPALRALGVTDPTRAAHVGDRRRTDVAGARALGMVSVRYAGWSDDPAENGPEADHVLGDHRDLCGALGL